MGLIATWIFDVVSVDGGVAVDVTLESSLRSDGAPFARYVYPDSQHGMSPLEDACRRAIEEFQRSKETYD